MRKEKDVFCNLCQKSLSNDDFLKHLLDDHLPKIKLTCTFCQDELASICDLETHYNYEHKSDKMFDYKILQFSKLFTDVNDILSHTKNGAEWIQKSFSFGFDNVLSKKEIRSIVKSSYNDDTEDMKVESMCDLCHDDEMEEYHICSYCGQQFLQKCYLKNHIFKKHLLLPVSIKKAISLCDVCGTICTNSKTLLQHKSRLHRNQSNKKNSQKEKTSPFCHFCGKSLANKSNLRRHVLNQHSEEIGAPPNHNVFTCDHCKCFFSNKSSVKRHIENLHLKRKDTRKSISCFQCEQKFNSIKNLNAHLTIEHKVTINEEKLQFSNLSEFWEWKQEEEIRTNSRFIQLRGLRRQRRKGEEISTLKFVCNRSGIFHSKSHGKRAYRIKGSSKIGRYCSAYIEIMFKDNASVDGIYCSTHSGHDNDLRYLTLTMDEKREIYDKIKSGASFSAILDEIRNSVGKEIKRKHLVTNKDLHNIVTTFKKLSKLDQSGDEVAQTLDNVRNPTECQHSDRNDRNFNNDLDICADLWVETCQRMINRFDQNEPRAVNDFCKVNDPKNNHVANAKNIFVDDILQQNNIREKPDRIVNEYVNSMSYINDNYTPNGLTNHVEQSCYKPPTFSGYESENNEGRMSNDVSYYGSTPRATPSRQEVKDFCGISSISADLRLSKDFYPADTPVASKMIDNHASKISSVYSITDTEPFSSYDFSDKIPPMVSNPEPNICLPSSVEDSHNMDDSLMPDLPSSDDEREITDENAEESSNKQDNEVSDLRDKVNSVTALYNIVESELDERKKNIIRNYVDNMFRVLQYRYNKCKTKKKRNNNQEKKKKRISPTETKKQAKLNQSPHPKPPTSFSCSSSEYPHQDVVNNSVVSNIRPDATFMRWDQY